MFKSIRAWFASFNKLPAALMAELQSEGIILMNEAIRGTITYRDFRAPGKRFLYKKSAFISTIAITKTRLLATSYSNVAINVPYSDGRFRSMQFSIEDGPKLGVAFDASLFQPKWSGSIEYRFKTPNAEKFLDEIQKQIA
ncbi:MAG: hypothetical protein ABIO36_10345 [Pyrinomonadaceae bacterium]